MIDEAKDMIPHWEPVAQISLSNAGPKNRSIRGCVDRKGLPDGVNDDHIVHHDDDPGQAAQDEYECDHDENQ